MDRVSLEVKVGVVVTAAVAMVLAFLFLLGEYNPFTNTYTITATFNYAGGIKPGADVQLAGAKVGKVNAIRFLAGEGVKGAPVLGLVLEIDKRAKDLIRADSAFDIRMESLLGGKVVEITPGSSSLPPLDDKAVIRGNDPPRLEDLVNQAVAMLEDIKGYIDELSPEDRQRLKSVLASLARLSGDDVDNVRRALKNAADASDDLKAIAADARPRVGPMLDDLHRTLDTADPLLREARTLVARLDRIASDLRAMAPADPAATRARVNDLLTTSGDLKLLIGRLERLSAKVETEYGDLSRTELERIIREFLQQQGITVNVGAVVGKPNYPPPPPKSNE